MSARVIGGLALALTVFSPGAGLAQAVPGGTGGATVLSTPINGSGIGAPGSPVGEIVQDSINAVQGSTAAGNQVDAIRDDIVTLPTGPGISPGGSAIGGSVGAAQGGDTAGTAAATEQSASIQQYGRIESFTDLLGSLTTAGQPTPPDFSAATDVRVADAEKLFDNFYPAAVDGLIGYNQAGLQAMRDALGQNSAVTEALAGAGAGLDDVIAVGGSEGDALVLYTYDGA